MTYINIMLNILKEIFKQVPMLLAYTLGKKTQEVKTLKKKEEAARNVQKIIHKFDNDPELRKRMRDRTRRK